MIIGLTGVDIYTHDDTDPNDKYGAIVLEFNSNVYNSYGVTTTITDSSGTVLGSTYITSSSNSGVDTIYYGKHSATSTSPELTPGTYTVGFSNNLGDTTTHRFYVPDKVQYLTAGGVSQYVNYGTAPVGPSIYYNWNCLGGACGLYMITGFSQQIVSNSVTDAPTGLISAPPTSNTYVSIPMFSTTNLVAGVDTWEFQALDSNGDEFFYNLKVYHDFAWDNLNGLCSPAVNCATDAPSFAFTNNINTTSSSSNDGSVMITPTSIAASFGGNTTLGFTVVGVSGDAAANAYSYNFPSTVSGGVFLGTTLNNLYEGGYTVTCTDTNNCDYSSSFIINVNSGPSCFLPVTVNPITYGCDSATMSIDIGDTSDVYDVVWSDSTGNGVQVEYALGTQAATNSYTTYIPGDYTVTVYLQGGCTSYTPFTHTFTGVAMPVFSGSISGTDETFNGLNDGTAQINGGINSFDTYLWSTGETTAYISNLAPGTYTCEVMVTLGSGISTTKCPYSFSIVIGSGNQYPDVSELDVCLNLNTGKFEFIDNNDYNTGQGFNPPYNIAITIEHSNGLSVYSGLLTSPDITLNNEFAASRTYDSANNLGENFSIDIPTYSPNNYVDDIYKITFEWNFDSTSATQSSKAVYLNATDLDAFGDVNIETELAYNCDGDMESRDITNYNVSSIPYTFTRTHELFAPPGSGLPSPVVSTGLEYTHYDLYSGEWSNIVTTDVTWDIPSAPSYTGVYIEACVKKTFTGYNTENVNCFIDDCIVNQFIKNLKNRYDSAVCDRDIININKYKDKFQRANELLVLYNIGDDSTCASDYDELWDILEISNLDDITSLSCCGDPSLNESMVADGSLTFDSINCPDGGGGTSGSGGGGSSGGGSGGGGGGGSSCPCDDSNFWSGAAQMAGDYSSGDYVKYTTNLNAGGVAELCYQLYNPPAGGFNTTSVANEEPGHDNAAYWNFIPCGSTGNIVWGCTDSLSTNYDSGADLDDGSCIYPVYGCTDPLAVNYDASAVTDDGSCNYISGCANGNANWYGLNNTTNLPLGGYAPYSGHFHEDSSGNVYISGRHDAHDIGFNQWTGTDWQDVFSVFPTAFTINWQSSAVMDSANNIYITSSTGILKYTAGTSTWALLSDPLYTSAYLTGYNIPDMLYVDSSDNIYIEIWGGIKKWDGSAWSDILNSTTNIGGQTTGGITSSCRGMLIDSSDDIYAVVYLSGGVGKRLVKYDGSTWTVLGDDNFNHRLLTSSGNHLLRNSLVKDDTSGYIYSTGTNTPGASWGISKWDGSAWSDITYNAKGSDSFMPNANWGAYDAGGRVVLDSAGDVYVSYLRSYAGPKGQIVVKKLVGTTWVYLTPNTSAVTGNSITANMFIDSLDNIWVNGVKSARNSVYILDSCLPSSSGSCSGTTTVNDANFENYLENNSMGNATPSDNLVLNSNICNVTNLVVSSEGISDLTGIEGFVSLEILNCDDNNLTTLDISSNTTLTGLSSKDNSLTTLDVSANTALTILQCSTNQLTSLDVSANTALTDLLCSSNPFTTLDISNNTALTLLQCGDSQLTSLDTSTNVNLITLVTWDSNSLATLDLTTNTQLEYLNCAKNALSTLDVTNNTQLQNLECSMNSISTLDVTNNTALTFLSLWQNNVTTLDVSNSTALDSLDCSQNSLTALDVTNNTALTYLRLSSNSITTLNVSANTALTYLECTHNSLTTLDVSNNTSLTFLWCYNNSLTSLDLGNNIDLTNLYLLATANTGSLVIHVGAGDVPGTTGGSGAGGLQTRVEYATANFTVANNAIDTGTTFAI